MKITPETLLRANRMVLVGLLGTPMLLFLSLFFFDDPSAARNPFAWAMFFAVWAYPVVAFIAARRAIHAYREGDFARLRRLTWLTCGPAALGLSLLTLGLVLELTAALVMSS